MTVYGDLALVVTDHAMWRAAERFQMVAMEEIEEEVTAALRDGRFSDEPPAGINRCFQERETAIYCWTPDGYRVYAVRVHRRDGRMMVTTAMRPFDRRKGGARDAA